MESLQKLKSRFSEFRTIDKIRTMRQFLSTYRNAIIAWAAIIVLIEVGLYFHIDNSFIAVAAVLIGFLGQAFAALIAWIGLVPLVGPLVAKVLSVPFIWLLNGIGYLVSIVAIKRGYPKDVLNYRVLTITFLVGITIGYVLGRVI
jgi:CHASE2 domain-containing sensor protein